jgi:chaperone required for assembly of F1-ATPase
MRRFYSTAAWQTAENGYAIALDDRPVMTPDRARLIVPTQAMAEALVAEWQAQGAKIDPASMPMTGFANAAIDKVASARQDFIATIAAYGESDLLCYRAEGPAPLVARQAESWDPLLDWASSRYDIAFVQVSGIIHRPQPDATLSRLRDMVGARSAFELAAMAKLVSLSGSLVLTLALVERQGSAADLWARSCVDEIWQAELWGEDEYAQRNRSDREHDFLEAAGFLALAQDG